MGRTSGRNRAILVLLYTLIFQGPVTVLASFGLAFNGASLGWVVALGLFGLSLLVVGVICLLVESARRS